MDEIADIEQEWFEKIGAEYQNILRQIRSEVHQLWQRNLMIRQFTDHSLSHSIRIINKISELERYSFRASSGITEYERMILIAGTYLHDIGMQCSDKELLLEHGVNISSGIYNLDVENQLEMRKNHHLLSKEWIRKMYDTQDDSPLAKAIKLLPFDLIDYIGDLCKYHSKEDINKCVSRYNYLGKYIRVKLMAALLRLGDEMDINSDKVKIDDVRSCGMDPGNAKYFWYHYLTELEVRESTDGKTGVLSLKIKLNPEDYIWYSETLRRELVERFKEKNGVLFSILINGGIVVQFDIDESETVEVDKNRRRIPEEVRREIDPVFYNMERAFIKNDKVPSDVIADKIFTTPSIEAFAGAFRIFEEREVEYTPLQALIINLDHGRLERFLGNWDKAKEVFNKCLELLKNVNSREKEIYESTLYMEYGSLLFEMGDIETGLSCLKDSLEAINQSTYDMHKRFFTIAKVLKTYGNMLREQGGTNWQKAEEYLMLGLGIMNNIIDKGIDEYSLMLADYYREIGNLYANRNDICQAEKYYSDALDCISNKEINPGSIYAHFQGIIEYHRGKIELRKGNYQEGLKNLKKSSEILEKFSNPIRLSFVEDALGTAYLSTGDNSRAKKSFLNALGRRQGHKHFKAYTLSNIAGLYLKEREYEEAEKSIDEAIQIWERLGKFDVADAHLTYGKILEKRQDFKQAKEHFQLALGKYQEIYKNDPGSEIILSTEHRISRMECCEQGKEPDFKSFKYLVQAGEYSCHTWLEKDGEMGRRLKEAIAKQELIDVVVGIGDDAAVIRIKDILKDIYNPCIVMTTDSAPGSLCRSDKESDGEYAAKFGVVHTISDLLAMGATPIAILLNLSLKRDTTVSYVEKVIKKIISEAEIYNSILIGGDIKESSVKSIGCVGVGVIHNKQRPIKRSGAKPGHIVAISLAGFKNINPEINGYRKIGVRWAADYLEALSNRKRFSKEVKQYHGMLKKNDVKRALLFLPYRELLSGARTEKIASAIDTSDGVMSCLEILARESSNEEVKIGFILEEGLCRSVIDEGIMQIADLLNINPIQFLFNAGHDWEVVMTIEEQDFKEVRNAVREVGGEIAPLGRVIDNGGKSIDRLYQREIGLLGERDNRIYRIPIFTDEKFVSTGYEERINEWEDLDIVTRLQGLPIDVNYDLVPEELYLSDVK